ncbi:hypothetical protein [Nonomuraea sp. NPDC050310]
MSGARVLLGGVNRWCPRWLDRLLSVEGDTPAPPRVLEEAGVGQRWAGSG